MKGVIKQFFHREGGKDTHRSTDGDSIWYGRWRVAWWATDEILVVQPHRYSTVDFQYQTMGAIERLLVVLIRTAKKQSKLVAKQSSKV